MSGTGVPPGMGQNPGFQHPGVPQQPWYPQGAHPVPKYNRVTLGVVAILVGWLGIHKFMLGQTTAGIIMLLISLFTCGMVSSVIGLVEGILYLTKSDAEFYQTYEVERKAWF
jgi:TM2 domain-containing membrane protein YozV